MDSEAKNRLLAAHSILREPGSFRRFDSIKSDVAGIHRHLDRVLEYVEAELSRVEPILGADFIALHHENLPDNTEAQKARKDAARHFAQTWEYLREEVEYVHAKKGPMHYVGYIFVAFRYLFRFATNPIGIFCIFAVAFVTWSSLTSVEISIRNRGCPTIVPSSPVPNFIPGLYIPNDPIPSGGNAELRMPTIPITFEDHGDGTMTISSIFFHMTLQLKGVKSIMFDDMELLLHRTDINLSKQKEHYVQFSC